MRSKSLLLHACTGVTLTLAMLVLLADVYGLPPCDGTFPPPQKTYCSNGTVCPDVDSQTCFENSYICLVVDPPFQGACEEGGDKNIQLCKNVPTVCTHSWECFWNINISPPACACSDIPVLDDGDPPQQVYSTAPGGTAASCDRPS
jgi:hypothetical protein